MTTGVCKLRGCALRVPSFAQGQVVPCLAGHAWATTPQTFCCACVAVLDQGARLGVLASGQALPCPLRRGQPHIGLADALGHPDRMRTGVEIVIGMLSWQWYLLICFLLSLPRGELLVWEGPKWYATDRPPSGQQQDA